MGKGDIRSKKGKIHNGSFGKSRPARPEKKAAVKKEKTAVKSEKAAAEK